MSANHFQILSKCWFKRGDRDDDDDDDIAGDLLSSLLSAPLAIKTEVVAMTTYYLIINIIFR
jgi:hypothetical protein